MTRFPKTATSRPLASLLALGAIATVMVLSTMDAAWAADTPADPTPASTQSSRPSDWEAPTGTHIKTSPKDMERIVVYPGAVHAADDEQWSDHDISAPELPMARG